MNWSKLITSILICQGAGMVSSIFLRDPVGLWYNSLNKPIFNPPDYVFGPVWTVLFLLMGVSLYIIWNQPELDKKAIGVFGAQLILNMGWTFLFFGLKSPLAAFVEIIVLWLAILATILMFYRISNAAGWLLVPYIIWVTFAAVLNLFILILN